MKTVWQALLDEVHYPLSPGFVENVVVKRGLNGEDAFDRDIALSEAYKGAVADCLWSLLHAVNFSESDKSVGSLSDEDKRRILLRVNAIYRELGEEEVELEEQPMVYVGDCLL